MKLLVIDGNSILNRAFYGIKLLSNKNGQHTNAIYGFLTTLQKAKEESSPDAIAIAFDRKSPTFRHKAFSSYKANRKAMPKELASQLPILKELLVYLGYTLVECDGFEADDILGTLAQSCKKAGNECVIATGDRDSLQLVDKDVSVRIASTKMGKPLITIYNEDKILEDYGMTPKQLIDLKAIQGDTSDNIPGVKGIGAKGATELIQKFNNIDYIYNNLEELPIKGIQKKKLIESKESAYISKMLGTIRTDAPIDTNINTYVPKQIDYKNTISLMKELEFFSLIEKLGLKNVDIDTPQPTINKFIKYHEDIDLNDLKIKIKNNLKLQFLAEINNSEVMCITINIDNEIFLIHQQDGFYEFLKELFEDENIAKQTHNFKPLFSVLEYMKINLKNADFDTMLAAYLLSASSSSYEIERLCEIYNIESDYSNSSNEILKNIVVFPKLVEVLQENINQNSQESLLKDIEIPLSKVLAKMENEGFSINYEGIKQYGTVLEKNIKELEQNIFANVGYEFNINSPKQLSAALFDKLGLTKGKKTKSGYSTNAEVLENLRYEHPVVDQILEFRTLSKLKSTYCDGLAKVIGKDGKIHSNFNQVETRTGRISSTEPNLQNIPVRTEVGKELRKFFHAKDGFVLVDADYSQVELRVLAHVAQDPNMIEAFNNNEDIHTKTACTVFHLPEELITPLMRSRAKAVNFGIVYGISAFSLSKDIGVTVAEAKNYINSFLTHYNKVQEYMKNITEQAKKDGYVATMFGRRRYLPELESSNFNLRAFGERVAKNMPIQGAAADIIKIAMVKVQNRLEKENLNAKLILQVHDELIIESSIDDSEKAKVILKEEMENCVHLLVPLPVDVSIGKTWFDTKK